MLHVRRRPVRSRLPLLAVLVTTVVAAVFASTSVQPASAHASGAAAAAKPTASTERTPSVASHSTGYAFTRHDVMVRRTGLRWALNRIFPDFAPVDVTCRGLNPVSLRSGGMGFRHVRCTTGLNIPDFIYHPDRNGDFFVTRSW
jgi:hypothetical protein